MYDSANHCLVWRGVVSMTLNPTATPDEQEKNLDMGVTWSLKKIFASTRGCPATKMKMRGFQLFLALLKPGVSTEEAPICWQMN